MTDTHDVQETTEMLSRSGGAEELLANLTRAWQSDGEAVAGAQGALLKATSLNLVIFSSDHAAARHAEEIMPRLSAMLPCRVIHIEATTHDDDSLRASTHVHSMREKGARVVTCEQVTLKAGRRALDSLEGLVAPLISPDLPVVLWWRGNPPFQGKLFTQLSQAADRVIYDSSYFLEAEDDLPWAVRLISQGAGLDVAFTDVNWARLTPWRALLAQFFDGSVNVRALGGLDRVTIEYADPCVTEDRVSCQAWLILGWLASRLGWTYEEPTPWGGSPTFSLRAPQGRVAVQFLRRSDDAPPGLRAVVLHASQPREGTYRVEQLPDATCARTITSIAGMPALERTVSGSDESYFELIANELEMPGRDQVYEEALVLTASLQPLPPDRSPA